MLKAKIRETVAKTLNKVALKAIAKEGKNRPIC